MSEQKHTPGPWIIGHKLKNCIVTDTFQHGEWSVTEVNMIRAEAAANARLIAAAPETLEALKSAVDDMELLQRDLDYWLASAGATGGFDSHRENIEKARAAIANATGEQK